MKSKVKDKLFGILKAFAFFLLWFFLIAIVFLNVLFKLSLFIFVQWYWYLIVVGASLLISLIATIVLKRNYQKEYPFVRFVRDHLQGFVTSFFFLNLFILSVRKDPVLDVSMAVDLLGIEWAIFGITMGTFAIWQALIFNKIYASDGNQNETDFKNEAGNKIENEIEKIVYFKVKDLRRHSYIVAFEPVVYIVVNLFAVVLATASVFLSGEYGILQETAVVFAVFCCTNSLIEVVLWIVFDLSEKRKELIAKTSVKSSQINESFDNIKVITFLQTLENIDEKTPLKDFRSFDEELDACVARSYQLLLEYKEDEKTAYKNRNELLTLFDRFQKFGSKSIKKGKKAIKKLEHKNNKLLKETEKLKAMLMDGENKTQKTES